MQYRKLGSSDIKVSVLGMGCNNFGGRVDLETTRRVIHHAIDVGINHFDTADVYGGAGASEDHIGQVLGPRRKDIVLATKFGLPFNDSMKGGGSRAYVMKAIEGSLKRLRTDYIDLYYLHKPDPSVPIEETLRALDDLVKQGKVRAIANSNMTGTQVDEADATSRRLGIARFVAAQDELSLIKRGTERDRLPAVEKERLVAHSIFPARQRTFDRQVQAQCASATRHAAFNGRSPRRRVLERQKSRTRLSARRFLRSAKARHAQASHLRGCWQNHRSQASLLGRSRPTRMDANVKACDYKLSAGDLAELDEIHVRRTGVAARINQAK